MSWYTSKQQGHLSKRFMSISFSLNRGQEPSGKVFFFHMLISTIFLIHIKEFDWAFGTSKINIADIFVCAFISLIRSGACPFPDAIFLT